MAMWKKNTEEFKNMTKHQLGQAHKHNSIQWIPKIISQLIISFHWLKSKNKMLHKTKNNLDSNIHKTQNKTPKKKKHINGKPGAEKSCWKKI